MVAAMRSIETDEIVAIQRTRLSPVGQKIDRRMLGPAAGAAIKLDADDAVTRRAGIGEGIETCLTAPPVRSAARVGARLKGPDRQISRF